MTNNKKHLVQIKGILVLIILWLGIDKSYGQEPCVINAWKAFDKKDYKNAILHSDTCIDNFGNRAFKIQATLEADSIQEPPIGKVTKEEKKIIFARGILNDVGTAFFIKGRSAEYIYKKDKVINIAYRKIAIDAYTGSCRLKYARTWDKRGFFWSPCEASTDRLPLE